MMERGTVRNMFRPHPARKLAAKLYDIRRCCIYSEKLLMKDRGTVRNMFRPDPARKLAANLYDIYHCRVYSEKLLMKDRGTVRNMRNFYSKNKFEKLVHLVGNIIGKILSLLLHVIFIMDLFVFYVFTLFYFYFRNTLSV